MLLCVIQIASLIFKNKHRNASEWTSRSQRLCKAHRRAPGTHLPGLCLGPGQLYPCSDMRVSRVSTGHQDPCGQDTTLPVSQASWVWLWGAVVREACPAARPPRWQVARPVCSGLVHWEASVGRGWWRAVSGRGTRTCAELGGRLLTLQSNLLPGTTCTVSRASGTASPASPSACSVPSSWNMEHRVRCRRDSGPGSAFQM